MHYLHISILTKKFRCFLFAFTQKAGYWLTKIIFYHYHLKEETPIRKKEITTLKVHLEDGRYLKHIHLYIQRYHKYIDVTCILCRVYIFSHISIYSIVTYIFRLDI